MGLVETCVATAPHFRVSLFSILLLSVASDVLRVHCVRIPQNLYLREWTNNTKHYYDSHCAVKGLRQRGRHSARGSAPRLIASTLGGRPEGLPSAAAHLRQAPCPGAASVSGAVFPCRLTFPRSHTASASVFTVMSEAANY